MMAKKRSIRFYRTEQGKEPAREWLDSLRDAVGQVRIWSRIRMAETGSLGDCKRVGEGVSELRYDMGQDTGFISGWMPKGI